MSVSSTRLASRLLLAAATARSNSSMLSAKKFQASSRRMKDLSTIWSSTKTTPPSIPLAEMVLSRLGDEYLDYIVLLRLKRTLGGINAT